jgi:hypothetical protein
MLWISFVLGLNDTVLIVVDMRPTLVPSEKHLKYWLDDTGNTQSH